MSYNTQACLARDGDLLLRAAACAATEGILEPETWAWKRQWQFSAQPGWDEAYSYAISASVENPGAQENVITDSMILSAVQAIIASEPLS
jgi:hypothetical protein